jgi:hypothetical protein
MDDAARLSNMHRRRIGSPTPASFLVLVICLGLAACARSSLDAFKPKPTTTTLLVQSNPAGANAQSSLGATCLTPCTMAIGTGGDFTISFTREGYEPQAITVHSTMSEGGYTTPASPTLDPNVVSVALKPQAQQAVRQRPASPARSP